MPVRTSSVPVGRDQQSSERSAYDREKEHRERREKERQKEKEYRDREREREKPKEADGQAPPTVTTQKKKQEQRISTMTEAQIMDKLRKWYCDILRLFRFCTDLGTHTFVYQALSLPLAIPTNPSRESRELVKGMYIQ